MTKKFIQNKTIDEQIFSLLNSNSFEDIYKALPEDVVKKIYRMAHTSTITDGINMEKDFVNLLVNTYKFHKPQQKNFVDIKIYDKKFIDLFFNQYKKGVLLSQVLLNSSRTDLILFKNYNIYIIEIKSGKSFNDSQKKRAIGYELLDVKKYYMTLGIPENKIKCIVLKLNTTSTKEKYSVDIQELNTTELKKLVKY